LNRQDDQVSLASASDVAFTDHGYRIDSLEWLVREQACCINELEAANNHWGQEIEAVHADMHKLVKNLQKHNQITMGSEEALIREWIVTDGAQ